MIKNAFRYVRTEVDGEKFLKDTGNKYMLISQSPFKGKENENGEVILPTGVKVRLQIMEDFSEAIMNRKTGEIMEDNRLETFEATVVGCDYPLPFQRGEMVSLEGFLPEFSYYIDHNFILRFRKIEEHKDK